MNQQENLWAVLKFLTPSLIGVLGVILLSSPVRLFENTIPMPIIPLAVVYFWTIYDPKYLHPLAVFLIGFLQDLMSGGAWGVWASIYLVTQLLISTQREYFMVRLPYVVWMGFTIAVVTAAVLIWGQVSIFNGELAPTMPLIWQSLVTVLVFPLLSWSFSSVHRRVME